MLFRRPATLLALAPVLLIGCYGGDGASFGSGKGKAADGAPATDAPAGKGGGSSGSGNAISARRTGVVFLHGTGDTGTEKDFTCAGTGEDFHCEVKAATDDYWVKATIDSERSRIDGTRRPYAVLGCPLGSQAPWANPSPVKGTGPEAGSAACAGIEASRFLDGPDGKPGTDDDITDVVVVTHSGGSNVVRYMLQQHAQNPQFDKLHKASRGFIGLAAPTTGTYLADWVFTKGSLADMVNGVIGFFGGEGLYDDDGTHFIRTNAMNVYNRDPAKFVDLSKDVAGVKSFMGAGSHPDTSGDDAAVACGGALETKGLALLHSLYLEDIDAATYRDGCSDGFISCRSAMALANGDFGRVIFGRLDDGRFAGRTNFRAHNQSRRQCDNLDVDVRNAINAILGDLGSKTASLGHEESRTPYEAAFAPVRLVSRGYVRVLPAAAAGGNVALAVHEGSRAKVLVSGSGSTVRAHANASGPAVIDVTAPRSDGALVAHVTEPDSTIALALEAMPLVTVGQRAHVRVDLEGAALDATKLSGFATDPARTTRLPLTFVRDAAGHVTAELAIPDTDRSIGTWTAHVELDGTATDGKRFTRSSDVVIWASSAAGTIAHAEAASAGDSVVVTVDVALQREGHYGVRATLVAADGSGGTFALASEQSVATHRAGRATFKVSLPAGAARRGDRLSVRDVALVRHDDASTVAIVPEVSVR